MPLSCDDLASIPEDVEDERGPDDDLRLAFEATRTLDDDEKEALKALLEGFLLRHDARRWTSAS